MFNFLEKPRIGQSKSKRPKPFEPSSGVFAFMKCRPEYGADKVTQVTFLKHSAVKLQKGFDGGTVEISIDCFAEYFTLADDKSGYYLKENVYSHHQIWLEYANRPEVKNRKSS